jgi:hypothetical protein
LVARQRQSIARWLNAPTGSEKLSVMERANADNVNLQANVAQWNGGQPSLIRIDSVQLTATMLTSLLIPAGAFS